MRAYLKGIGWVAGHELGAGVAAAPLDPRSAEVRVPERREVFNEPDMRYGRLDDFSKVGLAAIALCLQDAGLDGPGKRPVGLAAATRYGCAQTDAAFCRTIEEGLPSPKLFAFTLPTIFLGEAAIRFGLTGPAHAVAETDPAGLTGLRHGLQSLAMGLAETVIAGVVDIPDPLFLPEPPPFAGAIFAVLTSNVPGSGPGRLLELAGDGLYLDGARLTHVADLASPAGGRP